MIFKKKKKDRVISLGLDADRTEAENLQPDELESAPPSPDKNLEQETAPKEDVESSVSTMPEIEAPEALTVEEESAQEPSPPHIESMEFVEAAVPAAPEPVLSQDDAPSSSEPEKIPVDDREPMEEMVPPVESVVEEIIIDEEPVPEESLDVISLDSGLPIMSVESVPEIIQCPFCLENIPADSGICEKCGNIAEKSGEEDLIEMELIPEEDGLDAEAVSEPLLSEFSQQDKDVDLKEEDFLNRTRPLEESPVPSILKETTLLTPATLCRFPREEGKEDVEFPLNIGKTGIGRDPTNECPFPDEEFISRHHCEIIYRKYQYILEDLGSANGSYVNDIKVKETVLRDGDIIQIGSLRFLFKDPIEQMKKKKDQTH